MALVQAALQAGRGDRVVQLYNPWRMTHRRSFGKTEYFQELRRWLVAVGHYRLEVEDPLLEPLDRQYLERQHFLHRSAQLAIGAAKTDSEKAARLFAFVVQELAPYVPDPYFFEHPVEVLIRGHGSCDQMAWVLAALAEQVGLKSLILFLRKEKKQPSYHTMVALRVDGVWVVMDPFAALDFRTAEGRWSALFDLYRDSGRMPARYASALFQPRDLPVSQLLTYNTRRGALPRWSLFESSMKTRAAGPVLWFDPLGPMTALRSDAARQLPKEQVETLTVAPYGEPMAQALREARVAYCDQQQATPSFGRWRKARMLYFRGEVGKALSLLQTGAKEDTVCRRFLAQALARSGAWEDALRVYRSLPAPWQTACQWQIITALLRTGREAEAKTAIGSHHGPREGAFLR